MNKSALVLALCGLLIGGGAPALAKRAAPRPVAAVEAAGTRYSAPTDAMGYVVATAAGKEQWRVRIYTVPINPALERDVQDNFITALKLNDGALIVTDERGRNYLLDLQTHKVTPQ